jgi:hypothetical protein
MIHITLADRMPESVDFLRGQIHSTLCVGVTKITPDHPSFKLKNTMYVFTCDFTFFNTILAKFSGDPRVMGRMGHGSRLQWVIWVMGQSECPVVSSDKNIICVSRMR